MQQHWMATEVDDLQQCLTAQLAGQNKARDVIESRSRTRYASIPSAPGTFTNFWCQLAPVRFAGCLMYAAGLSLALHISASRSHVIKSSLGGRVFDL
jgi:hypothetical protein